MMKVAVISLVFCMAMSVGMVQAAEKEAVKSGGVASEVEDAVSRGFDLAPTIEPYSKMLGQLMRLVPFSERTSLFEVAVGILALRTEFEHYKVIVSWVQHWAARSASEIRPGVERVCGKGAVDLLCTDSLKDYFAYLLDIFFEKYFALCSAPHGEVPCVEIVGFKEQWVAYCAEHRISYERAAVAEKFMRFKHLLLGGS